MAHGETAKKDSESAHRPVFPQNKWSMLRAVRELFLVRGIYYKNVKERPKTVIETLIKIQATSQSLIVFTCQAGCWIVSLVGDLAHLKHDPVCMFVCALCFALCRNN